MKSNDYKVGDLIQTSQDYIEGGPEISLDDENRQYLKGLSSISVPKKFGIVIEPNHGMWGEYERQGTKVRWTSGYEEIVWHFEIERTRK